MKKQKKTGEIAVNASAILTEDMTLEEKLAAIDSAMAEMQHRATEQGATTDAPVDPALLTICDGCE